MTEYGMSSQYFNDLKEKLDCFVEPDTSQTLNLILNKKISNLDLTDWMINSLQKIGITTIKDILNVSEREIKKIYYVGDKRARLIKSAAFASVYEYLNG